jgi:hypothetical protein
MLLPWRRRAGGSVSSAIAKQPLKGPQMIELSPRHVQITEAARLGVGSGWYSTKVSGTFVTGPHSTEGECLEKIAELNPFPPRKKR